MTKRTILINARKQKHLTQAQLGALAGITTSAVSHLEAGRNGAKAETWDKLKDILNVPQRELRKTKEL